MFEFFGFPSFSAFLKSSFKVHLFLHPKIMAAMVAVSAFLEYTTGMPIAVILSFAGLCTLEWITGVAASKRDGAAFQSKRIPRFVLKVFVYITLIAILHQYRKLEGDGILWPLFGWTYWFSFSLISLTMVRSIIENLHRLGIREAYYLYVLLDNKYTKVISIIFEPPSEEKTNRVGKENSIPPGAP